MAKASPAPNIKRSGFRIGTRLILAFASVAALTAVEGPASSWLAVTGATILDHIGSHRLPTVIASVTFVQRSFQFTATIPRITLDCCMIS
jgi:hypothetical protein